MLDIVELRFLSPSCYPSQPSSFSLPVTVSWFLAGGPDFARSDQCFLPHLHNYIGHGHGAFVCYFELRLY